MRDPMSPASAAFLKVENLSIHYPVRAAGPFSERRMLRAVDDISFEVARGSSFGIVGESGSGKSTTAAAIMRLVDITAGRILFDGAALHALAGESLRVFRRRLQIIFQDPYSSLNPRARLGEIIRDPLDIQKIGSSRERDARVAELLELVGLRPEARHAFPHQFSGGQRQRVGIARALATSPELIVCDEPVSALDVAIQAQILNLLKRLQRERGLTYVFISHDLGVIRYMCDQVAVMYLGKIVETGSAASLFSHAGHPYTKALLAARPSIHARARSAAERVRALGDPPSPIDIPPGCRFASRCPLAEQRCREQAPELRAIDEDHRVACHLAT
jgi:oligopeptide/dipeptide ABC transporter ATP-binding protein